MSESKDYLNKRGGGEAQAVNRRRATALAALAAATPAMRPPTSPTASPAKRVVHFKTATEAIPNAAPLAVLHHAALPNGTTAARRIPTRAPAPRHAPGIVQQSMPGGAPAAQHGRSIDIGKLDVTIPPNSP